MGIVRLNELPEGSGSLTNDDIFVFMDDPAGSGITKKISLSQIAEAVGGGGGGNPFDQDLNTTDFPTFSGVSLSNGTTLAQGTFDNSTGGNNGISLNCYVGYELNWQGGHLKCTQDGGATSANITLDSALQFSDNVVVCSTADNLALKYAAAKTLTPGGNPLSSTNRATLIVMPGTYSLSSELQIDTQYVDILGLGSMKLHRGCKTAVTITNNTISVLPGVNDIKIKGISVGSQAFKLGSYNMGYYEDCIGGDDSFGAGNTIVATFVNCVANNTSFGGMALGNYINCIGGDVSFGALGSMASGSFTNCSGGEYSFGGLGGTASGSFTNCSGGNSSFGSGGTASGTFINCEATENSFGGGGGTASGIFRNCVGGAASFGGGISGICSGSFEHCTGGPGSFASNSGGVLSGTLLYCRLVSGSGVITFRTPSGSGKIRLCIDGNYDVINSDAP